MTLFHSLFTCACDCDRPPTPRNHQVLLLALKSVTEEQQQRKSTPGGSCWCVGINCSEYLSLCLRETEFILTHHIYRCCGMTRFASNWTTPPVPSSPFQQAVPIEQANHISGYKPSSGEIPPPALDTIGTECLTGECDCGKGLPCGEYLIDHRNQSLRTWLIQEFVLGKDSGLGNPYIDGFYCDDSWKTAPASGGNFNVSCDLSPTGGATEEDAYCSADMGLTKQDVVDIFS